MTAFKDRVSQAVSGTPGTGTITLGAAQTGYQALGAGDDAKTFDCLVTDTGNAWEVFTDGVFTNSGTTLTRGTFVNSSTGSPLSLTSAAIVSVSPSATRAAQWTTRTDFAGATAKTTPVGADLFGLWYSVAVAF